MPPAFSQAEIMSRTRRLCLVAVGLLLSFAFLAAPHTVHHGLSAVDVNDCPVLAAADQTNGDLPAILPLPTPLPLTYALPTLGLILPERFACQVYRSRAPPLSLPA